MVVSGVDVSVKGRRIYIEKRFPKPEGISFERELKTLREVHLIDVPASDVVPDPGYGRQIVIMGKVALQRARFEPIPNKRTFCPLPAPASDIRRPAPWFLWKDRVNLPLESSSPSGRKTMRESFLSFLS